MGALNERAKKTQDRKAEKEKVKDFINPERVDRCNREQDQLREQDRQRALDELARQRYEKQQPGYKPPSPSDQEFKPNQPFEMARGGKTVTGNGKEVGKNFGSGNRAKSEIEAEINKAKALQKILPDTIIPSAKRNSNGDFVLVYPQQTPVSDSKLSDKQKNRISKEFRKEL